MTERVETPEVSFSLSGEELLLRDEAGGGEVTVETEGETSLTPASDSWFDVPMDGAVSLEVESVRTRDSVATAVRDVEGEHYGNVTRDPFSLRVDGTYLELSASLKVIVYVERGEVTGYLEGDENDADATVFEFDEPTRIVVGARSFHEEPAATMTVPDEPEALMEAVSYLGSSIKEWSAERSWPTLRGHPPAIESGATLQVPDRLSKPETGVTVGVPADIGDVLRVTPLAHYFGADVVPEEEAQLRFEGHTEPLGQGQALEQAVDDLIARSMVLDSLVRIDGYYSLPRYEYDELAPELPFYPPALYDEPISQQLLEYLEVPFDTLEQFVPRWSGVGYLEPDIEAAEAVPYLANSLARVRVTSDGRPRTETRPSPLEGAVPLSTSSVIAPGTASLPKAGRARTADRERHPSATASVLFVDDQPPDGGRFGRVNWDFFDLGAGEPTGEYRDSITCEELRAAFRANHLYIHYGNRVTPEGFVCSDGVLGFDELPSTNTGAVSFQWDQAETAGVTGIFDTVSVGCLTAESVPLRTAEQFAAALVLGYSVAISAELAGIHQRTRHLGDASLSLAERPEGHPPGVYFAEPTSENAYRVSARIPIPFNNALGRVATVFPSEAHDEYQLANTPVEFLDPVSPDRLAEIAENGGIVRPNDPHSGDELGLWSSEPTPD